MSIEFILDGRPVSAEAGETILQVATREGIEIPTLCYAKNLTRTTSCFVCIVRDCKTGKFLPSCSAYPAPGQEIDASSNVVREMRRTALNLLLSEHAGDCEAPCTVACPAHAAVEEYIRAGRQGDFLKSLQIIKKRIPLPLSIGRVCPRFCEKNCRRNVDGEPVAINEFKRTAADLFYDTYRETLPAERPEKVAIVGAGPAGLAAGYYLRTEGGVQVKIFEAMPQPGGMLRYGIPEYRLPKQRVLNRELKHFSELGIEFEYGRRLGENLSLEELKAQYDAVILGLGCWKSSTLRCPGEELAVNGIDFLREVAEKEQQVPNPGRVIVVGGGNTAMDCLRTAIRLGAPQVDCFYRRTEHEMPAEKIEIAEAREEGVQFNFLAAPVQLARRGAKLMLTLRRMELGAPDASGRRKPIEVPGSDFEIEADTVIAAIGQKTLAPDGVKLDRFGNLEFSQGDKVYAAGDCVSGAATVVEAVAMGRQAALAVLTEVCQMTFEAEPTINVSRGKWQDLAEKDLVTLRSDVSQAPREKLNFIPLEQRKNSFAEVTATMEPERVRHEGERCLECSCTDKHDCKLRHHAECYQCQVDAFSGGKPELSFDIRHPEIIQDRGKCIKCGICVKTCKELVQQSLLSQKNRGFATYIGTAFEAGFPASCTDCGLCVEACPTGALGWRHKK